MRTIFHGYGNVTNQAIRRLLNDHYLRRKPPMQDTFEAWDSKGVFAILTFGVPASRHMQKGACPSNPDDVLELNRLWVRDDQPKGTASWFISQCLKRMPPRIILSYADTAQGHLGVVYRAANFNYAGWTDMDRKTPRFDYLVPGKHSRAAFRSGGGVTAEKVRRRPKVKYWTVTGNKKHRRRLMKQCTLPVMCWKDLPPPLVHKKVEAAI